MNLGTKRDESKNMPAVAVDPDLPEMSYPSFTLSGDKAKQFLDHYKLDINEECEVDAKIRLTGIQDGQYGTSVTVDVISIESEDAEHESQDQLEPEPGQEFEKQKKEEKSGYRNPAVENLEM